MIKSFINWISRYEIQLLILGGLLMSFLFLLMAIMFLPAGHEFLESLDGRSADF